MARSNRAPAWAGRPIRGVLFDLDGTLVDTASDIADALNRTLGDFGSEPLEVADVARMIGRGSPMLIERAAAARRLELTPDAHAAMLERFFEHYERIEADGESLARPYPGAGAALRTLHAAGVRTAVVTNKHRRFAVALLERLEMMGSIDVVVGGDTCERRKPDPQPLTFACESMGVNPGEALMIGDSTNDVRAARGALIPIICVPYGYNEGRDSRSLDCDAMIPTLDELAPLLWPPRGP